MGIIIEDFDDPYVIEVETSSTGLLAGSHTTYVVEVETGPQGPPGASGGSAWTLITDKPATFPPDAHLHTSVDVTDFSAAVANLITGKADDSAVVKLTGNQTVGGIKTFSSNPVVPDGSWAISKTANLQANLDAKALDSVVVKLTGDQTVAGIKTFSSAPIIPDASLTVAKTSGLQAALDAKSPTTHNHDSVYVALTGNQTINGIKTFLSAPIIPDASLSIAKTSGLQAALDAKSATTHNHDTTYVALTGNQTIAGIKTFSSSPVIPDGSLTIAKTTGLQAAIDAKAADADVVKLTGNQTIAGIKTFSSAPVIPDNSLTIAKTSGLQAALDSAGGGGGTNPYMVAPADANTDIGPLIQAKLNTYGLAMLPPNPTTWQNWNTKVTMSNGQAIIGAGQFTTRVRSGSSMAGQPLIEVTGINGNCTIAGMSMRGGVSSGTAVAQNAVRVYLTGQPTGSVTNPDTVHIIKDLFVEFFTSDGIYVGGSNAYDSNARETRIENCYVTHNGGWGIYLASSDCFLTNNTTHGNGPGGYYILSGQSGSTKIVASKAYYETIGIDARGSRCNIKGGEIQDCGTGIVIGTDCYVDTVIDNCGTASTAGLEVRGSGNTVDIHFQGRNPPGGAPGTPTYCIQMVFGSSILSGFINTNRNGRANDYANTWLGANRPAATSVYTLSPTTA